MSKIENYYELESKTKRPRRRKKWKIVVVIVSIFFAIGLAGGSLLVLNGVFDEDETNVAGDDSTVRGSDGEYSEEVTLEHVTGEQLGEQGTNGVDTPAETVAPPPELLLGIERKDYATELYMEVYPGDNTLQYFYAADAAESIISPDLYARQMQLKDYLGVELIAKNAEGDTTTYIDAFAASVKNKDGAIDLFVPHATAGVVSLVQSGCLKDLKSIDGLQLDRDHWDITYMESISLHDRYYLGYGDFCFPNTYLLLFDKEVISAYGFASPYDMVQNGTWTLEQMMSMTQNVYVDSNADALRGETDMFGMSITERKSLIGFLHASDLQIVEKASNGEYQLSGFGNRETELIDRLQNFLYSDSVWASCYNPDTPAAEFGSGSILMTPESTRNLDYLTNLENDYGFLPYPMFSTAQADIGYRHLNFAGYITVPSYSEEYTVIGESLDLLNYWGNDVLSGSWKMKMSRSEEDMEMLNLIFNSLCTDFALAYSDGYSGLNSLLNLVPTVTDPATGGSPASFYRMNEAGAAAAIQDLLEKVKSME